MNIQPLGSQGTIPAIQPSTAPTLGTASQNIASSATGAAQQAQSGTVNAQENRNFSGSSTQVDRSELDKAVKEIQGFIKDTNTSLDFHVDQDTDKLVVKVIDTSTKEVIKQIPSEDMLALAKALDKLKGLLVSQKA